MEDLDSMLQSAYNLCMESSFIRTGVRAFRWAVPVAAVAVLFGFLMYAPEGVLGKADAIGYAVCHRIDVRSFHIGVEAMPLCARCTGMYLGALLGLTFFGFSSRRRSALPERKFIPFLAVLVLAFAIDGSNSYLYLLKQLGSSTFSQIPNLYIPNNTLRLLTGTGMGLVIAIALFPAFNQTFWKDWDPRPALFGWKQLLGLVGLALVLDLVVLADVAPILYVLAMLSAGTVLLLLSSLYAMVVLMVFRHENRYSSLRQAWLPLMAGFTVAMTQILATDIVRYTLTATWSGFKL
jgi:uncharacterized membrane protein